MSQLLTSGRLWLLLSAFALLWFGALDYRKLVKPDEGRYAEIAREMVATGDWTTPRLNGIKYFEKPPLQYWATALAFKFWGESEWTARIWPASTGFALVLATAFAGMMLFGERAGLYGAAVLASSLLTVFIGHMNTLDMGLTLFMSVAMVAFVRGQTLERAACRRWMIVVWAALALAVLSKGLVAPALAGASLLVYTLLSRNFAPWRNLYPLEGLAVFLAITSPWFVAVSLANPEFPAFFFVHEHIDRFLQSGHRRTQPWWYFVPVLLAGALPWTTAIAAAAARSWRSEAPGTFSPRRFLLAWSLVVFTFFSVSSSKLPSYILPIFPALALLTGPLLAEASRRTLAWHGAIVSLLAAAALAASPFVASLGDADTPPAMLAAYAQWLTSGSAIWLAMSLIALGVLVRNAKSAFVLLMASGGFIAANAAILGHESLAGSNSAHGIAAQVRPLVPVGVPFYSVESYDQTLPFYLGRTLTLVNYRDEMDFGLRTEPALAIPSMSEFAARWRADRDAFAVMTPETLASLEQAGLPMRVVARDTRRIIVRKP